MKSKRGETPSIPVSRGEPVHLLVDSTGLRLCGPGEWLAEKHGTSRRQIWRKLHVGVDAEIGQILASELTANDVEDGSQIESLLDQITGSLACFTGDGAYDQAGLYGTVDQRHPEAQVVVPRRSTAVPSDMAESTPTQRPAPAKHRRTWPYGLAKEVRVYSTGSGGGVYEPFKASDWRCAALACGTPPCHRGRYRRSCAELHA
jgi:Transposase DDE domain